MSSSKKRAYSRHLYQSHIKDVFDTRGMPIRSASSAKKINERDLFRSQIKDNFDYENLDSTASAARFGKKQCGNNMFTSQISII